MAIKRKEKRRLLQTAALLMRANERVFMGFGQNTEEMMEAMKNVKTGQITYAVRDTKIDDKEIRQGDIMGIGDHGILAVGKEIEDTAVAMVQEMADEDSEIISVYYGADVTAEDAEQFAARLEELYPDFDVELNEGGQPIYYYVVSVE